MSFSQIENPKIKPSNPTRCDGGEWSHAFFPLRLLYKHHYHTIITPSTNNATILGVMVVNGAMRSSLFAQHHVESLNLNFTPVNSVT
jgi:hypothetical protein